MVEKLPRKAETLHGGRCLSAHIGIRKAADNKNQDYTLTLLHED